MNDIDKLNHRVDGAALHYNQLDARLRNEAVFHAKLAKRVAQLEAAADDLQAVKIREYIERFSQEYNTGPARMSGEYAPVRTVTTMSVSTEELERAAKTFVRSIGTVNRRYLNLTVRDSSGDAAKALRYALSLYPMAN